MSKATGPPRSGEWRIHEAVRHHDRANFPRRLSVSPGPETPLRDLRPKPLASRSWRIRVERIAMVSAGDTSSLTVAILEQTLSKFPPVLAPERLIAFGGKAYLVKVPDLVFRPPPIIGCDLARRKDESVIHLAYGSGIVLPSVRVPLIIPEDPLPFPNARRKPLWPQLDRALVKYLDARKNYLRAKNHRRKKYWFNVAMSWGDKSTAYLESQIARARHKNAKNG